MLRHDDRPYVQRRPESGRMRYELAEPYRDAQGRPRVRFHRLGSTPDPRAALERLRERHLERLRWLGPSPEPAEMAITRSTQDRIEALAAAIACLEADAPGDHTLDRNSRTGSPSGRPEPHPRAVDPRADPAYRGRRTG